MSILLRWNKAYFIALSQFSTTYLFVIPDCEDSVLSHDAIDAVDRMLPDPVPRFSKSPVLRCFLILRPWQRKNRKVSLLYCVVKQFT